MVSGAPRLSDTSPLNLMVAPGLPGALKMVKPCVPAPLQATHSLLSPPVLADRPLRCAPVDAGFPAIAAVAVATVMPRPATIALRTRVIDVPPQAGGPAVRRVGGRYPSGQVDQAGGTGAGLRAGFAEDAGIPAG